MRHIPLFRKVATPCVSLLLAALWLLPALAQDPSHTPQFNYSPPAATENEEKPVPFAHNEHNKKAKATKCATCHHPLPGMKGAKAKTATERRCADCHKSRPGPNDPASLMLVSHKLCQNCHTAQKKGPVDCDGCHKK